MVDSFLNRRGEPVTTMKLVPKSHSDEIRRRLFVWRRLPGQRGDDVTTRMAIRLNC
jgi:hypothetical protein